MKSIFTLLALVTPLLQGAAVGADEPRSTRLLGEKKWQPAVVTSEETLQTAPMEIWEVTRFPNLPQTAEQKQAADALVQRSFEAAAEQGWNQFEVAVRQGFRGMYGDYIHYANEAYILDDVILDPERPEFLMYYRMDGKRVLTGFMYLMDTPRGEGPQIGGNETVWHYHTWTGTRCMLAQLLIVGLPDNDERCRRGVGQRRSPEMMHVWLLDHPGGRFASQMAIDHKLLPKLLEKRQQQYGW